MTHLQRRGAFIHYGAILGTIMVVAHVIIGQRRMVQPCASRAPDRDGLMGKQRSDYNAYFALPVVFVSLNHCAMTFGHRWGWLLLVLLPLPGRWYGSGS
jgi:uncharacterized membrane protein